MAPLGLFRSVSGKTRLPLCGGWAFPLASLQASSLSASPRYTIHASPVRDARLPSASGWSPGRFASLRLPSLRSIRAAHDGSDAIPFTLRSAQTARPLSLRLGQNPPASARRLGFSPRSAPSVLAVRFSALYRNMRAQPHLVEPVGHGEGELHHAYGGVEIGRASCRERVCLYV